jgi:hypothetical protein
VFCCLKCQKSFVEKALEALLTIELAVGDEKESLVDSATESFVEERLLPADSSLAATGASDDVSLAFLVDSGIQKNSPSTTIVRCLIDVRPSSQTNVSIDGWLLEYGPAITSTCNFFISQELNNDCDWFTVKRPLLKTYLDSGPSHIVLLPARNGVEEWLIDHSLCQKVCRFFPGIPSKVLHPIWECVVSPPLEIPPSGVVYIVWTLFLCFRSRLVL